MVPDQARVVIVGGGIMGCGLAYHLAHLGWTDVGYMYPRLDRQQRFYQTPHIDKLAERGVVLDHFYAYPMCNPTRLALTARNTIPIEIATHEP